ncbi:MAG TPA: type IV pilus modification protein PilV [Steroidobacteraceae bacterium]|nr:type IV pilus modification protein PilV [Steroidobacteraceae bacterium]
MSGRARRMVRRAAGTMRACRGFSLVEVMVALVITSIGLLGLAKMESLALSSTGVASGRSIAAIQASSLAATMHANRGYWASAALASTTVQVVNGVVTIQDPVLSSVVPNNCSVPGTTACTVDQMAAYDVQQWAAALGALLPASLSTITCTQVVTSPITCTITIQWAENAVALNAQQTQMSALQPPTYTLNVQP